MESISSRERQLVAHMLEQLIKACEMIILWNIDVNSPDDYLLTPDGVQKMAASCMMIESIGESIKKIDKLLPGFLTQNAPEVPWRSIKGLRDHIAHGYFNIDADIVYDVAKNEMPSLKSTFIQLSKVL
jgi:uncharacterized protein with HEPN domain